MNICPEEIYKVTVAVPEDRLEKMMDHIDDAIQPVYPGYRRTFTYFPAKGTWIPENSSRPFIGTHGKKETTNEMILQFVVKGNDLRKAVDVIVTLHPYEEPAMDIVMTLDRKKL